MEFGYEERSKRLIERLDRIQNYLQSLPPLPKIGNVNRTEDQNRDLNETRIYRSNSPMGSESASSAGSSTTKQSVSTRLSKSIPKDELAPELLQCSPSPSPDSSRTSVADGPSPIGSQPLKMTYQRKKRRKDNRIQDPNRPTTRTSFGVDIGQGINVINYIKQNATLGSDAKNKRLTGIITKSIPLGVISDKSLERGSVMRQGLSRGETSGTSMQSKNKEAASPKLRPSVGKQMGFGSTCAENLDTTSDSDIYRVRYQERAIELPHHQGLDTLQELFVPYVEHHPYPERGASRNESGYE